VLLSDKNSIAERIFSRVCLFSGFTVPLLIYLYLD